MMTTSKTLRRYGLALALTVAGLLLGACSERPQETYIPEVINRMTPVKDQGKSKTCWIYAMLAAIETEHLAWGDSVNLSPYYVEAMLAKERGVPRSRRGMGATLIRLIQKYGIVGYDAMRSFNAPAPRYVFMLGAEYTAQEFARSVCAPGEYIALTSTPAYPYYQNIILDTPDNWLHDAFLNVPIDTLLNCTERAVRQHHGVCWESRSHAMAIVGIARDSGGEHYFIMKNSWGTKRPNGGLDYLSFEDFKRKTLAVEMTRKAYGLP